MQKPFPGPNVMLPALRLSDPPDLDSHISYKRREATWKRLISNEHKKWCLCGSFMNHFLPPSEPLKQQTCSIEEEKEDGRGDTAEEEDGATGGEVEDIGDVVAAGGEG
nr:ORF2 [Torque teno felis virus]